MAAVALGLSGCGTQIAGHPEPAAGFGAPDETAASATSNASPVPPPTIPQPRGTDIDPCVLFAPEDLTAVGEPVGPPRPDDPGPGICTHGLRFEQNAAAAGFGVPFAEAAARQPGGTATAIEGHSTWLYCEKREVYQTCAATTAVREDSTLVTLLSLHGASAADTAEALHGLTGAALRKLPPG
ncbi:DUF3558 domain-containing protein [Allosaccharopolyspora coralli]|uniref:DUF3558 domain-containing protein n=1 Tax=Allosaccharopolyspora coralli TaxID=2665642 RepID=A0A5Q3QC94_9PSEU|nr:DUF3558 domain-containing protein [Allosaccharopolyspora coralli]